MSEIKFTARSDDGRKWSRENSPDSCIGLVYLNVGAVDGHDFGGWVSPQVRALVHAAPELLEACELVIGSIRIPDDDVSQEVLRRLRLAVRNAKSV